MKPFLSFRKLLAVLTATAVLTILLLPACKGHDHDQPSGPAPAGMLVPVTDKTDATWLAQARTDYPLDHCLVCGDRLDDKSPDYIYQQAGKPDRLVRFCGEEDCFTNFKKDAGKYLTMIDDAAAAKAAAAKK